MKIKITPKSIEPICSKIVLARGKKFYADHKEKIMNFHINGNKISTSINDILNFDVKIDLTDMSYSCSCNYGKIRVCKHIIAVLYFEMAREKNSKNSKSFFDELKSAINNADRSRLEMFIINEAAANGEVQDRALNFFMADEIKHTVAFYKKEVNSFLKHLIYSYYIPMSKADELMRFVNNIELMAKQGGVEEAIKNYRAVFEVLENKLKTLDDSYGIIQNTIRDALNKYISYSGKFYTEQKERRTIIGYLWKQFLKDSDICHYYTEAIKQFCSNEKDWECYRDILFHAIATQDNKKSFMFQNMVEEYIDALIKLKDSNELENVFNKFSSSSIVHKKIDYLWSIGRFEDAIRAFEDNVNILHQRDNAQIRHKISDYLSKNNKGRYLNNLIALFDLSPSHDLYEKIKQTSGDFWGSIEGDMYNKIKDSPEFIDSYLKSGRMREAFMKLTELDRIDLYDRYLEILSPLFPDEYFDHYKNSIIRDYKDENYPSRNIYRSTLKKIRNLSIIDGAEGKYTEFLVQLKEENKQRPSFLDEMGKILE